LKATDYLYSQLKKIYTSHLFLVLIIQLPKKPPDQKARCHTPPKGHGHTELLLAGVKGQPESTSPNYSCPLNIQQEKQIKGKLNQ